MIADEGHALGGDVRPSVVTTAFIGVPRALAGLVITEILALALGDGNSSRLASSNDPSARTTDSVSGVEGNHGPYTLVPEVPSVEVYRELRVISGLSPKTVEAATIGLPNTWYGVVVRCMGEPVGMGRVIGDGGCHFQIVDICVRPEHRGRGLGRRIMAALTQELEQRAPDSAYVSLIADGDARHLYSGFGFVETAPASVGMARILAAGNRSGSS